MAVTYIWPTSLPQSPQKGFSESLGVTVLRTPQDAGIAKTRLRGRRPDTLNLTFLLTSEQVNTLDNFIKGSLNVTSRFGFPHPRTATQVEARVVTSNDGDIFICNYLAPGYWTVQLNLEILP